MAGTNLGTAYVSIMPSAKGMGSALSSQMQAEGGSAGNVFGSSLASTAIKIIAASGIGLAVKKLITDSLEAGGALQQSFGGLDTIYGKAADGMKDLAYEASKAGISANDYAEQAVSFGASLRQAFGGDTIKAAETANMAILDMADNSAKFGSDLSSIQNAYQGFAKQNYTMLDNLKLGYGGTKTEMERLLADAEKLTGIKYNIDNLGDVYSAIHAIQDELGVAGVAAAEAKGTFTGSAAAMKASWQNLKADMALGNDLTKDFEVLSKSLSNYLTGNLLPMVGNIFKSIPTLLGTALKEGFKKLPNLVETAKNFLDNLASGFEGNGSILIDKFKELASYAWVAFKNTDWLGLGKSILNLIGEGLKEVGSTILEVVKGVGESIKEKFAGADANWSEVGTSILSKIGEGLGQVGRFLFDKIGEAGSAIKEKFENIDWQEVGKNVVTKIGEGFIALGEALKTIWESAKESFKDVDWPTVGRNVIEFIVEGFQTVGSLLWGALKTIGQTAWAKMKEVDWLQLGKDVILIIWAGLQTLQSMIWDKMKEIGQAAWNKVKEVDWLQLGKDVIKAIWEGLGAIGSWIWEKLKLLGDAAVEKFKAIDWLQLGKDVIKFIWEGLGSIGNWIYEKLQVLGEAAKEKFQDIDWKKLGKDVITFIWNGLSELGSTIWEKLKEIGEDAVAKFKEIDWKQLGVDIINLIWDGITNVGGWFADGFKWLGEQCGMNFLQEDFQGVGETATSDIATGIDYGGWHTSNSMGNVAYDAYSQWYGYDWYGIGSGAISGIESGVLSYAWSLYNSISNVAYNMWNTVRSYMRIGSPSKLMRDTIGKWIPIGLAEGIEDESDVVTNAMQSMVADATNAIDPNIALTATKGTIDATVSTSENGTDSGIVINVYPSQGMDERAIADMVEQRLMFALRQEESAWGTA